MGASVGREGRGQSGWPWRWAVVVLVFAPHEGGTILTLAGAGGGGAEFPPPNPPTIFLWIVLPALALYEFPGQGRRARTHPRGR